MFIRKICVFLLFTPLYAEILIVQKKDSQFEALSIDTLKEDDVNKIADILFKYQWPMCTMNTELTTEEKEELFQQSPNAEARFITKKLHEFNPNYYAFWVPTTFYELVCLHTLFQQAPSFLNTTNGTPFLEAVSGIPNFLSKEGKNIIDTAWKKLLTKTKAGDKNWETKKESFTVYQEINNYFYKQHHAYFEINERVATILFDHNKNLIKNINSEDIYKTIKSIFNDPKEVFIKEIQTNYVKNWWSSTANPNSYPLASRVHFHAIDTNYIKQALDIEYKANDQNKGLLFRGTKPFFDKTTKKPLVISPIHKDFYATTIKPADPYSISFGNSLFAGCIADATATAYQFLSQTQKTDPIAGYGLYIDKAEYIENQNDNIFLISPLAHIASLFTYGEMFHSRSKAALNPKKPTRIIGLACNVPIIDPDSLLLITRDPRKHAYNIIDYFIQNGNLIYPEYKANQDEPDKQQAQIMQEILKNAEAARIYTRDVQKISKFIHKVVTPKLTQKKLVILAESLESLASSIIVKK